ncbi:hypothetical protein [Rhizobium leguminosarum]|uniref:Histidine kinase n=1 Tax=Rhizobium leguminosarum TaxID=384 RepID=A0A7K3VCA9_RHILE|nr:hypothetical protein [Rhizobium leguminosarum]NEK14793.1 hypothetical protein [Rhizobium leguminosarum]
MSRIRIAIVALACLAVPGTSVAQSSDHGTKLVSIVSFAGAIKYAVTKASPFALGYYYNASNTDPIEFHECGKAGSPRVLAKSDIEDTAEDCTSLPGAPTIPLLTEIETWVAQADGDFIVTSFPASEGTKVSTHVKCADVPGAALVAAAKQSEFDTGVAVDGKVDVDKLRTALGTGKEPVVAAGSQIDLCGKVKTFWTIPLKSVTLDDAAVAVYGLSVADPSNLDQVNALEKSLEKRE